MRTAGRVLLLACGLWLLAATIVAPVLAVPRADDLLLHSRRMGVPHLVPAAQGLLLMLDVNRMAHRDWQIPAAILLCGVCLLCLLMAGSLAMGAAVQWLRSEHDPYVHARRFGLAVCGWALAAALPLPHLLARATGFRYLGLTFWGSLTVVAALYIANYHREGA